MLLDANLFIGVDPSGGRKPCTYAALDHNGKLVALNGGDNTFIKATVDGGPSGIVVDNYSMAGQASSIYLMAGKLNTAYKFTQSGLE